METAGVLMFVLVFFWSGRGSPAQGDAVLALAQGALGSMTFLALVDRVLPFVLEVLRLSS
ncbi:hypothetical protein [Deinococcus indicus]|uniref:hypothetical protein n=1 Tax=Deinococcus indicus TaxID=223556 RepID=UPI001177DF34|nr:hypothetical protein [Deinococcus indicus]